MTREKELQELSKRERQFAAPEGKAYLLILFAVLIAIMMIDEFASNAPSSVQTAVIHEFFVQGQGMTEEQGASAFSFLTTVTIPISILAVLINTLSDRWGRKPLLIFSALGMGVAMFILYLSPNLTVYTIGRLLVTFFIAQDMHQIYIMEVAPDDKRATYTSVSGAFGLIGIMLISVARSFNTHNEVLDWRGVFLIPAVVAVLSIAIFIVLARETKPFLKMRIEYLKKTPEERKAEKGQEKAARSGDAGMGAAIRYVFRNRQTKVMILAMIPLNFCMLSFAGYGELMMTSNGMLTSQVNTALLIYPIVGALLAASVGVLADKLGRKPTALTYAIVDIVALLLFVFGTANGWNPVVVGILYGIELRGYWSLTGILGLSLKENVPTRIRATCVSVYALVNTVTTIVGSIAGAVLPMVIGLNGTVTVWGPIMMALGIGIYMLFGKETKGIVLDEIQ